MGAQPYAGKSNSETTEFVLAGNRMTKPERCPEEVYKIMQQCWLEKTKDRPSMRDIHSSLRKLSLPGPNVISPISSEPAEFYVLQDEQKDFYE
jgi:hypothetical protein